MKAAIINEFGGPEKFEIRDMPKPIIGNDDDIIIKVKASSVNPVDWKIRKGNLKMILGSKFPIILGFDASGVVDETGKSVSKFKKGDHVYSRLDRKFGRAYAEYAVGSEKSFALKPDCISHFEAAAVPLAALTALQGLRDKGKIRKGHKVLIIGAAGGVGCFAVQLTKFFGAECIAVCSNRHRQMMEELQPNKIIDYTIEDFKLSGIKYDIIFDIIGNETFLTCKNSLKKGGVYITSLPRPKVILHKFLAIFHGKKAMTLLMKPIGSDIEFISNMIENNKFKIYIDKVFPLESISEAHTYSESGRTEGKIVIDIDGD